jgi:hypothetical protein
MNPAIVIISVFRNACLRLAFVLLIVVVLTAHIEVSDNQT